MTVATLPKKRYGYVSGGTNLLDPRSIYEELGMREGHAVADLGAGSGAFFTIQAAMIVGTKGRVYAVDILRSVLSSIEGKSRLAGLTNVKTVWSNLEIPGATRIPDDSIDFTILANVLFQTKQVNNVVEEAVRLTKPSGKIVVIDWKPGKAHVGPPADQRISQDEIRAVGASVGLEEVRSLYAGDYHYGLIFVKN